MGLPVGSFHPNAKGHCALRKPLIVENAWTVSEKNGLPPRNAVLARIQGRPI